MFLFGTIVQQLLVVSIYTTIPNVSVLVRSSASRVRDQESYHTILDILFDTRYLEYRPNIDWHIVNDSYDTRYIEVSRYYQVSISNVHKYRDTSIYRVSNQH